MSENRWVRCNHCMSVFEEEWVHVDELERESCPVCGKGDALMDRSRPGREEDMSEADRSLVIQALLHARSWNPTLVDRAIQIINGVDDKNVGNMARGILVIEGGIVQSIISDVALQVIVKDYDCDGAGDEDLCALADPSSADGSDLFYGYKAFVDQDAPLCEALWKKLVASLENRDKERDKLFRAEGK